MQGGARSGERGGNGISPLMHITVPGNISVTTFTDIAAICTVTLSC